MGKEFIEYQEKTLHCSTSTVCYCLTNYAKDYIKNDNEKIVNIDTKIRDAILVDAINYLGSQAWCDFGLYTCDLYDNRKRDAYVEPQALLSAITNYYANYIFDEGITKSVLRNNHMNEVKKEFDVNDGAIVLLDFINYIAKINDFDRTFTMKDLYDKYLKLHHKMELKELKRFLELSGNYTQRLQNGETVDNILDTIKEKNGVSDLEKVSSWQKVLIDDELYVLTYAYAKLDDETKLETDNEVINAKIKEMSKR